MTQPRRVLTTWPLVAGTYFMVAGGPYGLEELVRKVGFGQAALVLTLTPLVWSLPTSLMVAELAAALPEEGGYYAWCRRALGPFWGFQEAWLSLAASVFDMAIYPVLFVTYLARFWPAAAEQQALIGAGVIAAGVSMNLAGSKALGRASELMTLLLLGPFLVLMGLAILRPSVAVPPVARVGDGDLLGAMLIAMWNTMGWDNASTVAGEVVRPQRTYPLAMLAAVSLVALTYVLPVLAASRLGLPAAAWETGAWVEAARVSGGGLLAGSVVVGGMVSGFGMFNALLLSYSRVPAALAADGYLPAVFARRTRGTDAPWLSLLVLAVAWCAALGLSFERLVVIDLVLYGSALMLEFVALVALRLREPLLERPFRVPGGVAGALLLAAGPGSLLGLALARSQRAEVADISGLVLGTGVALAGCGLYFALRPRRRPVGA